MTDTYPESLRRLIASFSRLPGIGPKSAQRLAFFLIKSSPEEVEELVGSLSEIKKKIRLCSECGFYADKDRCAVCNDPSRDRSTLCIVERPQDVLIIEKAGYRGLYHVLGGSISPMRGVGPDDLSIKRLLERLNATGSEKIREAILATNPSLDGETTALYIARKVKPLGLRTTIIARGLPLGGDLEFTDEGTLTQALEGRREILTG